MNNKKEPNKILAKVLAESIKNSKDGNGSFDLDIGDTSKIDKSEGMIIGLHTDWGGGKTTLIEDLQEELGIKDNINNGPYFFQKINAWEFNKENKEDLWKSIISYFYLQIIDENTSFIKKNGWKEQSIEIINLIAKIGFSFKGFDLKATKGFDIGKLFVNKYKEQINNLKDNISLFYSIKEKIKNILQGEKKGEKNKFDKYILVIDDLDRCSPKEVVNLLDSLKIFLDLPNIIVIVAVDRRHIEKGIYEVYNKDNGEQYLVNPDEYLEKIIHLPIDLFLFDDDIKEFNEDEKIIKKIEDNTRKISLAKKILNFFYYIIKNLDFFRNNVKDGNEDKNSIKKIEIEKDEKIKEILKNNEINEIITFGLSNNPRKILRFRRLFKFYYNVFKNLYFFDEDKDSNEKFLIFWLILKLEWGDYFKEIVKNPILLYYVDKYEEINIKEEYDKEAEYNKEVEILSKIFYEVSIKDKYLELSKNNIKIRYFDLLNNFERQKIQKYIIFLKSIILDDFFSSKNISILFSAYILGEKTYLIEKNKKNEKELLKPLVNLVIFNDYYFREKYIELIQSLYSEGKMNDNFKNNNYLNKLEKKIIGEFLGVNEVIDNFLLKDYIEKNNIDLSEYGLKEDGEMITGLMEYEKAKNNDEKRYLLGNKIFFDKILENFDEVYNLELQGYEIEGGNNEKYFINKNKVFKELIKFKSSFYEKLGENHILNNLKNGSKRTIFGEIVNQMSFSKYGPSLGGMAGATDFIQLENIVISNIENASDKNKYNVEEWRKVIKGAIILDEDISLENQTEKYIEMIKFVEEINDETKIKIKRLKKRLLYVFSHFWALQNIKEFPVYYGKSREGLAGLGMWSYEYGDLNDAIKNYIEFSKQYGKLVNQLKNEKLVKKLDVNNFKNTLNEKFKDYLGEENNTYITNYYYYKIIQDFLYNILLDNDYEEDFNKIKPKEADNKIIIGDIWIISIDDKNNRPFLVLDKLGKFKYLVVGLTTKEPKNKLYSYYIEENFLNKGSFINFYLLETIDNDNKFINKIGKINKNTLSEIKNKYKKLSN